MKKRIKNALLLVAISILITMAISLCFAAINSFEKYFIDVAKDVFVTVYIWCFGGSLVGAFLITSTKLKEDSAIKYGHAFYYGTAILSNVIYEYMNISNYESVLLISAIIIGLCCYIYWLKNKPEPED